MIYIHKNDMDWARVGEWVGAAGGSMTHDMKPAFVQWMGYSPPAFLFALHVIWGRQNKRAKGSHEYNIDVTMRMRFGNEGRHTTGSSYP